MWVLKQCSPRVCDVNGNMSYDSLNTNLTNHLLIWKLRQNFIMLWYQAAIL